MCTPLQFSSEIRSGSLLFEGLLMATSPSQMYLMRNANNQWHPMNRFKLCVVDVSVAEPIERLGYFIPP